MDGHSHVKKISKRWHRGLSLKQSRCSVCHLPPAAHLLLRLLAGSRPRLGYLSFWGSSILFGLLTDHFLSEQTSRQLMLRLNTCSRALLRKKDTERRVAKEWLLGTHSSHREENAAAFLWCYPRIKTAKSQETALLLFLALVTSASPWCLTGGKHF